MSVEALNRLVREARALAGDNPCIHGHDWITDGGRACHHSNLGLCSMPVFNCSRCPAIDYGDDDGPGDVACREECEYRGSGFEDPDEARE